MKRITANITATAVILALLPTMSSCGTKNTSEDILSGEDRNIKAAVITVTEGSCETYNQLRNGTAANLDASLTDNITNPADYDILYLEKDAASAQGFNAETIENYVYNGGAVVLDNSLIKNFSYDFLGASELVKIDGCPADMSFPETDGDLQPISGIIYDYSQTFKNYANYSDYEKYDYGYGIIPSTAQTIGEYDGAAVYSVNNYGSGYVFLTNPMLPGDYTVSSLEDGEQGEPFAFTTTGATNILRNYYSEYVSKKKFGFAVERAFGSFASRPAAWELHYEDITGVKNNSLETFAQMCIEQGQMPSYTIARNFYTWFKRAESLNYLIGDGNGGYKNDFYENAYCSGTHVVSGGKWIEQDYYENTDSYFEDNAEYTKRLYPCPTDINKDGQVDFICGSADGRFYLYTGSGMNDNYETSAAVMLTDAEGNALSVGAYSSPSLCDIDGDGTEELLSGSEGGAVYAFKSLKSEENPDSLAFTPIGEILSTGLTDSMIDTGDLNGDGTPDLAVGSRDGEMRVYNGYASQSGKIEFSDDYISVNTNQSRIAPCIYNGVLYGGTLEGYVARYAYNGAEYSLKDYLKYDDISRRGDNRVTVGMNCVPRFADIDGDGIDDLICGSLEYGMAYPIDSPYFPYKDKLQQQLKYCDNFNIYIGVHSYTNKYATPEHEARELEYHKNALNEYGLSLDGIGANQHTWFTSKYGYDGSGINGFNPNYRGTFAAQENAGLLWNSGSTMPESSVVPQNCAEDAIPMPLYMPDSDFLLLETSNTPHGDGAYSYISVKYDMPMLFYNHCDYIYEASEEQAAAVKKVGQVVDDYNYMFVGENQMAKAVAASYNADIKTRVDSNGDIAISAAPRDTSIGLYDERYSDSVGVKIVFGENDSASNYNIDANVWNAENDALYAALDRPITLSRHIVTNGINIKQINVPAKVSVKGDLATVEFEESGLMCVRVAGEVETSDNDWTVHRDRNGDTIFMKFGKAQQIEIKTK